ncbi:MAG TPA: hypothetical protein VMK65_00020, partial [Longimicrobiales bacterium]|nr:hypothetical protein [Longimicrobiales bacterium]
MRTFYKALALALVAATAACGDDPTGIGDDDALQGTIVGRIDGAAGSSSVSTNLHAGEGLSVAASRVTASGALEALATASVAADGSYRIDGVP